MSSELVPDFEPLRPFSIEEAEPVLRALSKLGHVKVVNPHPFFHMPWPHICWVDAPEFHPEPGFAYILYRYPGRGFWSVIPDLPRLCLFVTPNSLRWESPFVVRKESREKSKEWVESLIKRLDEFGTAMPWRASPFVDPDQFRSEKVSEMLNLGTHLEEALGVRDKPSLGVEFSNESLELPLIEDRPGPGGGVLLISDPVKFAESGKMTSPYDRRIHFWVTEDEGDELSLEISAQSAGKSEGQNPWALLQEVARANSEYGGLIIYPEQIPQLAAEANEFVTKSRSASARGALEKIESICRSARNYRLGIRIHGKHEG